MTASELARWLTAAATIVTAACGPERRPPAAPDDAVLPDIPAPTPVDELPRTCEEAVERRSYIGCDYWPTVVANSVWSIFDYAVIVANAGDEISDVTIDGGAGVAITRQVAPRSLERIYLPWVRELKGNDYDECGVRPEDDPGLRSARADGGAYHLVSSRPVTVYQFSAIEYQPVGGPAGKDWAACPGHKTCERNQGQPLGCFSYTNDASLLLPSTALTGNYWITGHPTNEDSGVTFGSYFTVTGTRDDTTVEVTLSATASVVAGGGLASHAAGDTFSFRLDAGDVVQIANTDVALQGSPIDPLIGGDLSGSRVRATQPVQVLTGSPCAQVPTLNQACDHIEETNLPAETMGTDYIVTQPTGPRGTAAPHIVRLYGGANGTHLTFDPPIDGAPTTINAGEVKYVTMIAETSFRVTGDQPFSVSTFQVGSHLLQLDPGPTFGMGDPSQSNAVAIQQFRSRYVFLAPHDYEMSFIDIAALAGTTITLDGSPVTASPTPVGVSGYRVIRVPLPRGGSGAHVLVADKPVGVQVIGYGSFTSYQYPAGMNLAHIAPIL